MSDILSDTSKGLLVDRIERLFAEDYLRLMDIKLFRKSNQDMKSRSTLYV